MKFEHTQNTLKYKVGDRVRIVEGGWGISNRDVESLSGEVFEVISYLPDGYFGKDGYLLKPSLLNRFGYVPGEDGFIGGEALQLVEDSPKAQDNSWYESGGIPPIGANIEYKLGAGPWYAATVKYVLDVLDGDEGEIVIACPHLGFEQLLTLNKHTKIRPCLSPEQIAEQEREAYCDRIYGILCKAERKNNRSDMAEALYDAGLRFVEEE